MSLFKRSLRNARAAGLHLARRDEDHQIAFDGALAFRPEEAPANKGGNLIGAVGVADGLSASEEVAVAGDLFFRKMPNVIQVFMTRCSQLVTPKVGERDQIY